jgi:UDP-glucose:(heptosyl)LPS alpha-1,3-glucosyltransferase
MKVALILYKYFPYGGLQRDLLKIASECLERGHSVSIYTMAWEGHIPEGLKVVLIPRRGLANHRRCLNFSNQLRALDLPSRFDLVVGFNKVSCLDVYFAADPCYAAKALLQRSSLYRLSTRCRIYAGLEREVFKVGGKTQVLFLNPAEQENFVEQYKTEEARFHLLPPGVARRKPDAVADGVIRRETRNRLGLHEGDKFLLMVGSGFRTKGVDRSIRALADLPAEVAAISRLIILGQGKGEPLLRLAKRLGVAERVLFLGVKDDVTPYYLAADILLHPSRTEAAGMVLVEALTYGLPVLVTDVCGYAFHVEDAGAGEVVSSPFAQLHFSAILKQMLVAGDFQSWSNNGLTYAERTDLYSLPQKAVNLFEQIRSEERVQV